MADKAAAVHWRDICGPSSPCSGAELQQNEIYQDAVSDFIQTSSALLGMVLDL